MRGESAAAVGLRIAPTDLFWALGSLCNLHRLPFDAGLLARAYPPPHTLGTLTEALLALGCDARIVQPDVKQLAAMTLPCIALIMASTHAETPEEARPALIIRADSERILYFAAGAGTPTVATPAELAAQYCGVALQVARPGPVPNDGETAIPPKFGFRWFVPELLRHRRVWREVLAASLAIQLLALALPLLSQVIIDKVIVHRAASTLAVIAGALVLIVTFSSVAVMDPSVPGDPHRQPRGWRARHRGLPSPAVVAAALFRASSHRRPHCATRGHRDDPRVPDRRGCDAGARRSFPDRLPGRDGSLQHPAHADDADGRRAACSDLDDGGAAAPEALRRPVPRRGPERRLSLPSMSRPSRR